MFRRSQPIALNADEKHRARRDLRDGVDGSELHDGVRGLQRQPVRTLRKVCVELRRQLRRLGIPQHDLARIYEFGLSGENPALPVRRQSFLEFEPLPMATQRLQPRVAIGDPDGGNGGPNPPVDGGCVCRDGTSETDPVQTKPMRVDGLERS